MANYTITLSIKNNNQVSCTATYGFTNDLSTSSTATVASGETKQVQLETDNTSGVIYCKFSAANYSDSDIVSCSFKYRKVDDITISGSYISSINSGGLYVYNGSPETITLYDVKTSKNTFFGLSGDSNILVWQARFTTVNDNLVTYVKSNEKLYLVSVAEGQGANGNYVFAASDENGDITTYKGTLSS